MAAPRRYPVAEMYDERSSEFYRRGPRSTREYDDLDVEIRRGHDMSFLDDGGYVRPTAGAMVLRERPRDVEREEIIIDRERAPAPASVRSRARSVEREEIQIRRGERESLRRHVDREELDVIIRREEEAPAAPRRRAREVERDEVVIRRSEKDTIRGESMRRPSRHIHDDHEHEDDIIIRRNGRDVRGRDRVDEETIQVRHRSHSRQRHESLPPPRGMVGRETEEVVIRRRRERTPSPPPPPRREFEHEEIIIRRTEERARTPTPPPPPPAREPTPPPPVVILEPIVRPPIHQQIHQEIITHHRHIDHGVERAWSPVPSPPPAPRTPTPPPPPPPPPPVAKKVEEVIEVDIRRRGRGRDEHITIDHEHHERTSNETALVRHRSLSAPRRHRYDDELEEEADYYMRKQMERARVGEAHNGATKDWAIVDVPPGTERVQMEGAGGSSQEVTWQRYNGVRRAKFIAGEREFDSGFGIPEQRRSPAPIAAPPAAPAARPRTSDMWTEITKDLVIKDAIDAFGYQYEETEFFYYVMDYLRYEDVLQLVQFSDDIRQERRRRIREIEWEREQLRRPRHGGNRYYEHEVVIDSRRRH